MQTLATQHGAEPNPLDRTGLCLLSLDGGGVRGLSTLYILKSLMARLNRERQEAGLPRVKPCELFDLIGGTSTGGLIAIMLGRLEMDVDECIAAYSELMETVFGKRSSKLPFSWTGKTKARFDSKRLKSAVEKVVTNHNASSTELFDNGTARGCRVFVCSIAHETKEIVRLRSYSLTDETGIPATICKAALATSAATSYFDPVDIGARRFADGGLGANNPVDEVEGEASNIWCAETGDLKPLVKCFISIGTGNPGKKAIEDNILGFLSRTLVGIATQTEETEKRFIAKWRQHFDEKRYFRFNVDQGLQDIGLAEYQQQGAIEAATDGYINHQAQKFRVRDCVLNLKQKQNKTDTAFASVIYEFNTRRVIELQANARKAYWNVPFERNLRFVGRNPQLERLESTLFVNGRTQKTAVFGLGGVGKTQIALELAHRTREKYGDCSLLWVPATNVESFQQAYLNIGQQLGIPGLEEERADVKKLVQQYLSQNKAGQWLLIFDNADDVDMWIGSTSSRASLIDYLPRSSQGSIVFTTRSRKIAVDLAHQNIVEISEMDEETATQMLAKSLADPSLLKNHQDTAELVEQLTFLPLAIAQAAAYINKNGIAFADYLLLLKDQEESAVEILSEDFEDEARYQDVKNPVATTWLISFNQIRHHDPLAAEYLSIMSCIDPKDILQSLLPPAKSRKAEVDAIGTLDAYSFVSRQSAGQSLNLHRLVHLATRNWLTKEDSLARWEAKAIARLGIVFPNNNHANRGIWRAYLPHAQYILGSTLRVEDTSQGRGLCEKFGLCLLREGRYNEAKTPLLQAMEGREKALGKEHPDTLSSVSYLALVLQYQGKYEAAEGMNRRALEGREEALGKEHPDTLTSVSNLAGVLQYQGKYKAAEEMNRRALEGYEKALGKEHPDTLTSVGNLALVLQCQGKYEAAEEMNRRALEGYEKALGKEHPSTLTSVSNLALVLQCQGKYEAAEEMNRRALEGYEKALGKEHPDTLTCVSILAGVLQYQGKYEAAEEIHRRALEGREKALGKEHPSTLTSVGNLASVLQYQGKYEAAEGMNRRALEGREKALGKEHPSTLSSVSNLALVLQYQGKYEAAEGMNRRALEGREKALGKEHPDTLTSVYCLAFLLHQQQQYEAASVLYQRAGSGYKRALGPEHPTTIACSKRYSSLIREMQYS